MRREAKPALREGENDATRYRRPRRPVEVRRRARWKVVLRFTPHLLLGLLGVMVVGGAGLFAYRYGANAVVFRVPDLEAVGVANAEHVAVAAVRERFAEDVSRSVFSVPLEERRRRLEEILWVETATVQRLLPNRLQVYLRERTPVAFLRKRHGLWLVDRHGVVLPPPESASYSFPVLSGLSERLAAEERRARVGLYLEFLEDLDRGGKDHSSQISELDLSDPDNLRATVTHEEGAVQLHFGRSRYQEKFMTYLEHRALWRKSGDTVHGVDLRYRGQIVLNPRTSTKRKR